MARVGRFRLYGRAQWLYGRTDLPSAIPSVSSTWSEAPQGSVSTHPAQLTQWWSTFNDPLLTILITWAVASNLDLRLAVARSVRPVPHVAWWRQTASPRSLRSVPTHTFVAVRIPYPCPPVLPTPASESPGG